MGHHDQPHQRVRPAAVFGALAAVGSRLIGLKPHEVAPAGDHVGLAAQARNPEAVDHVGAFQLEHHGLTGGDMDLIGVLKDFAPLVVQIGDPPPPHLAGDADPHLARSRRLGDPRGRGQAVDQKAGQNHDRKGQAADPDQTLAADPPLPPSGTEQGDPQGDQHHGHHHRRHDEQHPGHHLDRPGEGAGRVQHRRGPARGSRRRFSRHRAYTDRPRRRGLGRGSGAWGAWRFRDPGTARRSASGSGRRAGSAGARR